MTRRARSTNFLRPLYRLGWLVIWGIWLTTLALVIPVVMPHDDVVGWGFATLAATSIAYVLHRLWDWFVVGRPLPWR
ncbi:MAG: hypothetical protein GY889_03725 [Proteobacteria bacterium]|nr:hypothetical protein [Pseudomonadota bacterium]|tara:strand:- start:19078 stop:19308 length:231 start_codon:yes stop_codon:yes gene_type:complete